MKTMLTAGYFCKKREFERYKTNLFETEKLLQRFVFNQELKRSGLWLSPDEIKEKASHTLKCLLDTNLIQNGLIVAGMKEHIEEVIA